MKVIILIGLFGLISCQSKTTENGKLVDIRYFESDDLLRNNHLTRLTIVKNSDWTEYTYISESNDSTHNLQVRQDSKFDSLLFINDLIIVLIDRKTIEIGNESVEVLKYYYDIKDAYDDEASIYFVNGKGLMLIKSEAWGGYSIFDNLSKDNKKLIYKILGDRTGFYEMPDSAKY